ncbi:hypothetical protein FISHEDRAFT_59546 [Fistulina hepatica ATCC 64428]|uniref:TFIIS N-terminal domain-containing protein n=1 Tax=Fistulina hepatica ATCC 64428 TaxID=1128425 RepID=A0A0D7A980_9AGAR|nr:hypothetical protein FISHEDRAFT_59546 [Fistulina hepatica ATCC 64428]
MEKRNAPVVADGKTAENGEENIPEANRVREWRHRLQKVFLSSNAPIRAQDMPQMHDIFTTIEQYDKMTVRSLQLSKIGKVMRHIIALADDKIPRENEFRFRERANRLVDAWQIIVNKSNEEARAKQVETPTDAMEADKAPETNGSDEHKRNSLTSPVAVDAAKDEPTDIVKTDVEAPTEFDPGAAGTEHHLLLSARAYKAPSYISALMSSDTVGFAGNTQRNVWPASRHVRDVVAGHREPSRRYDDREHRYRNREQGDNKYHKNERSSHNPDELRYRVVRERPARLPGFNSPPLERRVWPSSSGQMKGSDLDRQRTEDSIRRQADGAPDRHSSRRRSSAHEKRSSHHSTAHRADVPVQAPQPVPPLPPAPLATPMTDLSSPAPATLSGQQRRASRHASTPSTSNMPLIPSLSEGSLRSGRAYASVSSGSRKHPRKAAEHRHHDPTSSAARRDSPVPSTSSASMTHRTSTAYHTALSMAPPIDGADANTLRVPSPVAIVQRHGDSVATHRINSDQRPSGATAERRRSQRASDGENERRLKDEGTSKNEKRRSSRNVERQTPGEAKRAAEGRHHPTQTSKSQVRRYFFWQLGILFDLHCKSRNETATTTPFAPPASTDTAVTMEPSTKGRPAVVPVHVVESHSVPSHGAGNVYGQAYAAPGLRMQPDYSASDTSSGPFVINVVPPSTLGNFSVDVPSNAAAPSHARQNEHEGSVSVRSAHIDQITTGRARSHVSRRASSTRSRQTDRPPSHDYSHSHSHEHQVSREPSYSRDIHDARERKVSLDRTPSHERPPRAQRQPSRTVPSELKRKATPQKKRPTVLRKFARPARHTDISMAGRARGVESKSRPAVVGGTRTSYSGSRHSDGVHRRSHPSTRYAHLGPDHEEYEPLFEPGELGPPVQREVVPPPLSADTKAESVLKWTQEVAHVLVPQPAVRTLTLPKRNFLSTPAIAEDATIPYVIETTRRRLRRDVTVVMRPVRTQNSGEKKELSGDLGDDVRGEAIRRVVATDGTTADRTASDPVTAATPTAVESHWNVSTSVSSTRHDAGVKHISGMTKWSAIHWRLKMFDVAGEMVPWRSLKMKKEGNFWKKSRRWRWHDKMYEVEYHRKKGWVMFDVETTAVVADFAPRRSRAARLFAKSDYTPDSSARSRFGPADPAVYRACVQDLYSRDAAFYLCVMLYSEMRRRRSRRTQMSASGIYTIPSFLRKHGVLTDDCK